MFCVKLVYNYNNCLMGGKHSLNKLPMEITSFWSSKHLYISFFSFFCTVICHREELFYQKKIFFGCKSQKNTFSSTERATKVGGTSSGMTAIGSHTEEPIGCNVVNTMAWLFEFGEQVQLSRALKKREATFRHAMQTEQLNQCGLIIAMHCFRV